MESFHSVLLVAVIALVTAAIRLLPLLLFGRKGETSAFLSYLGDTLPYAIIGMLVVYCLKDVSFLERPYGIPEMGCIALVAVLHLWKRNTLLSILGGTVLYMVLMQHPGLF